MFAKKNLIVGVIVRVTRINIMQDTKYYEPTNIFRQPAINIKKRSDKKRILQSMMTLSTYKKNVAKQYFENEFTDFAKSIRQLQ